MTPTTATELATAIRAHLRQEHPYAGIKARTKKNARYTQIIITHERGAMTHAERQEAEAAARALTRNYDNPKEGTPYIEIWSR